MAIRNTPAKMGNQQIQGLADGIEDTDGATVGQLNAAIAALNIDSYATDAELADAIAAIDLTPYAPLASPTFTGDPKAPTASPGDNDTSIATTAFVTAAIAASAPPWTTIKKTANQDTTSTSYADDSVLQFSVAANKIYTFRGVLIVNAGAGGFRAAINGPAAPSALRINSTSSTVQTAYDTAYAVNTGSGVFSFSFQGKLTNGANAGTLALRLRQDTASGTTTFERGSYLEWMEIA